MAQVIKERMTAAEFLRLPEETAFVELIDGEITMSPSPITSHQEIVGRIYLMLASLIHSEKIGGRVLLSPLDVHLDDYNVVEPDVFWVSGEGSLCQPGKDGYWHGAPDLVVEVISPGSVGRDRGPPWASLCGPVWAPPRLYPCRCAPRQRLPPHHQLGEGAAS